MKKIKNTFLVFAVCFLNTFLTTNAQGIDFEKGRLDSVLNVARAQDKLVFVDIYTKWCIPCKQMEKNVFSLKEVGDFYNKNFINYKIDAEDTTYNGPNVAERYKVGAFPTYLYLNFKGELVSKFVGFMIEDVFIKAGKQAMGTDMTSTFTSVLEKYEKGDTSLPTLRSVILLGSEAMGLIEDKEKRQQADKLQNKAISLFMNRSPSSFVNTKDIEVLKQESVFWSQELYRGHALTEYIIEHYNDFKDVASNEEDLGKFLMNANYMGIRKAASLGNESLYQSYLDDINGILKRAYSFNDEEELPAIAFLTAFGKSEYAISQGDYDGYLMEYEKILKLKKNELSAIDYLMPARVMLNKDRGTPSIEELKKCIKYNEIAYKDYKNAYVVTDFGMLMAKLGNKEKAREYYTEALEMFNEMGKRGEFMIERFKKEMIELGL